MLKMLNSAYPYSHISPKAPDYRYICHVANHLSGFNYGKTYLHIFLTCHVFFHGKSILTSRSEGC